MESAMANQSGNIVLREYRKGNWTVQETMVLIEAKKMDEERRMKRHEESEGRSSKPAELRWKWVEDYCWRNGCLRSQNQCNDKWDNLMRDFKKVRDYERREKTVIGDDHQKSYWKIEKSDRKEKNLPSNMLPEIYDALVEVVERKGIQRVTGGAGGGSSVNMGYVVERPTISVQPLLPPLVQHPIAAAVPVAVLPLPSPPPQAQPPGLTYTAPLPRMYDSSDTSEHSDSPAKRRRREEGTSGSASGGRSTSQEVGSAITKSASIIAQALQASEERKERRHRELLSLHERRLQIEESKAEISRQGISAIVDAINKLSNSVFALAAHKDQAK